jgi:hypothetical protein
MLEFAGKPASAGATYLGIDLDIGSGRKPADRRPS